jgi:diacylglycerol kinase (CTP)
MQFSQVTPVLTALFFIIFTTDFLRFRNAKLNKLYCTFLGPLMREREVSQSYNGVIWYLLGLIIVFSLFPKDVSLVSVLLLSWADTAASTVGRAYGHLTPRISSRKSLAGSLASFATGLISAGLLYQYFIPRYAQWNSPADIMWTPETSVIPLWLLMLLVGLIGAVSEAIDVYDIDDNFTIPVLSAFFMWPVIKLGAKI